MKLAVILFAHGSRDPLWRAPIDAVAQVMRQQAPQVPVACAFLELTEPDLATAVQSMVQAGAEHIRVVPMFLGVGRHAREDLPTLVQSLQTSHPELRLECLHSIGEHPLLTQLMAEIALGHHP